ncbi:RibD family protein [Pseudonocardia nantongensis]|uniref:RibD family protein n=1 Tax=Pseudonocardia nantongensis TaxID=1181885 RepID=UPI0039794062
MTDGSPGAIADALLGPTRPGPDRPFVLLKYAQTLDGRIAATGGDSKWISGDAERAVTHALRARCDAIMVGVGTVLSDDPRLTVRAVPGPSPRRVVLDSSLRTPPDAALLDGDPETLLISTEWSAGGASISTDPGPGGGQARLERPGVAIRRVPAGSGGVDLPSALRELRAAGVRSVLVEGGSRVLTGLLAQRLVDRVVVAIAPRILGAGIDAVGELGHRRIADGIALHRTCVHVVGGDVLIGGDVG